MPALSAVLDHVAFRVQSLAPALAFFRDTLGMTVTKVDGDPASPRQIWLLGGLQIIVDEAHDGRSGQADHLGICCSDVPAAIAAAREQGAVSTDKGENWLRFPGGLYVELMPRDAEEIASLHRLDLRA